jgi:hypothetical protein
LTELSGLDQHSDFPPGRSGIGAKLAIIGCGTMFSMKMEKIADLTVV